MKYLYYTGGRYAFVNPAFCQTAREAFMGTGIRKQASTSILGLPLWVIAFGPDEKTGQRCGHAKGVIAIGDVAPSSADSTCA